MEENNKGDLWYRADLHVHTPLSKETNYGDQQLDQTWDRYVSSLEELGDSVSILGVNDYWTIDGYSKLKKYKECGRLKNVKMMFPVVEMRLTDAMTKTKLQNYHVAFDPDLKEEDIRECFLSQLKAQPAGEHGPAFLLSEDGIEKFAEWLQRECQGSETEMSRFRDRAKNSFAVSRDHVEGVIKQSTVLNGHTISFIGFAEADDLRNANLQGTAKTTLLKSVDGVFTASPTKENFEKNQQKLVDLNVATPLIHASDAHSYRDQGGPKEMGHSEMWIKCCLTFDSLRTALKSKDQRLSYGMPSSLLEREKLNPNTIERISVKRDPQAKGAGVEFRYDTDFNPGLVVVIGNKGQGKSALVDWLSLGNCDLDEEKFSFLRKGRFERARKNASNAYASTVFWYEKEPTKSVWRTGEENSGVKRIDYFPQAHIERLCSADPGKEDGQELQGFLEKLIFGKLDPSVKKEVTNLSEFLTKQRHLTVSQNTDISAHDFEELEDLQSRLIELDGFNLTERAEDVQRKIEQISDLLPERPDEGIVNDDSLLLSLVSAKKESKYRVMDNVKSIKGYLQESVLDVLKKQSAEVEKAFEMLCDKNRALPLAREREVSLKRMNNILHQIETSLKTQIQQFETEAFNYLNLLNDLMRNTENAVEALGELEERYGERQIKESTEEKQRQQLERYLMGQTIPDNDEWTKPGVEKLQEEKTNKQEKRATLSHRFAESLKCRIDGLLESSKIANRNMDEALSSVNFSESNVEVRTRIADRVDGDILVSDVKSKYSEDVRKLLDLRSEITLAGAESRMDLLRQYCEYVIRFSSHLRQDKDSLNKRGTSQTVADLERQLLDPSKFDIYFELTMDGKSIRKLSPGQRGLVLMLCVLYLDDSKNVLILDQPEDNLDNDTIKKHLIPAIEYARKRRQVIIVTHNANIGVLGEPDQVIICHHVRQSFGLRSGSLSNPKIAGYLIDVLEGAKEAFETRGIRYGLINSR